MTSDQHLATPLRSALEAYDPEGTEAALQSIRDQLGRGDVRGVSKCLEALNDFTRFEDTVALGQQAYGVAPSLKIAHQLSQALIEQHRITEALVMLDGHVQEAKDSDAPDSLHELRGKRGRAYKQLYIDARPNSHEPRLADYDNALGAYELGYERDVAKIVPSETNSLIWHAVNAAALRDHHSRRAPDSQRATLRSELDALRGRVIELCDQLLRDAPDDAWVLTSAIEVRVRIESRYDEAASLTQQLLALKDVSPFILRALLRQLRQLWEIDDTHPVFDTVMAPLQRKLAEIDPVPRRISAAGMEKIWGDDNYLDLSVLDQIAERASGIARVERPRVGEPIAIGTAFLVAPKYMLTCHHVVEREQQGELQVHFSTHNDGKGRTVRVVKFWEFDRYDRNNQRYLDVALLELEEAIEDDAAILTIDDRHAPTEDKLGRAYIIGHPQGMNTTQVSLHGSKLLTFNELVLQYHTPSSPGSSGSPVFDEHWNVVGVHTRGHDTLTHAKTGEEFACNQAVRIHRVIDKVQARTTIRRPRLRLDALSSDESEITEQAPREDSFVVSSPRIEIVENTRQATWWRIDEHGNRIAGHEEMRELESLAPLDLKDHFWFTFALELSDPLKMHYQPKGSTGWQHTQGFGDSIVNRIDPRRGDPFILELKGTAIRSPTKLKVSGWYQLEGQTFRFGEGKLGEDILVEIPNQVSCHNALQVFNFTMKARDENNKPYEYDPRFFMAPKKGSCG